MRWTCSSVIPKSASSREGAASTETPDPWIVRYDIATFTSSSAASSLARTAMSYRGVRLRCVATWPNWRSRSMRRTRAVSDAVPQRRRGNRATSGEEHGGVHRQGRRADAALRAEECHQLGAGRPTAVGSDLPGSDEERHHAALELAVGEPARDDVVRASLEERDARLDVVGRGDDEDRCHLAIGRRSQRSDRPRRREPFRHDEVGRRPAHGGNGIGRGRDADGPMPGIGERLLELASGAPWHGRRSG